MRSDGSIAVGDAHLVWTARRGDRAAFAELARRHQPTAFAVIARLTADRDLAWDVVQEATVTAMVSLDRLANPDRFGAWLCGIAINIARRWLRKQRDPIVTSPATATADPQPEDYATTADIARRVREAIVHLAPGQREAISLFYLQGLTHREVAAELGISVGAVKARLHQARASLAPRLSPILEEEDAMPKTSTPNWVDVSVAEVRRADEADDPTSTPHVVILREQGGERVLPIWIGPPEGVALAMALESVEWPRPMTYQFVANLVGAADAQVAEVRITRLAKSTFFAVVIVEGPGGSREVDCRPSDALNLAMIVSAPIRVDAAILDEREATRHTAWQQYATDATAIAAEVNDRKAQMEAQLASRREQGPESDT